MKRTFVKKGQFQHVFTFIMLILIAGVVLVLGYRFISQLLGQSCEVEMLNLQKSLGEDLSRYASYGSYHEPAYPVPCGARALCFIDADKFGQEQNGIYAGTESFSESYPAINAEITSPSTPPASVFVLLEDKSLKPLQLFSKKIDIPGQLPEDAADGSVGGAVICIPTTGGRFRVGMEGKGRRVVITDAG